MMCLHESVFTWIYIYSTKQIIAAIIRFWAYLCSPKHDDDDDDVCLIIYRCLGKEGYTFKNYTTSKHMCFIE